MKRITNATLTLALAVVASTCALGQTAQSKTGNTMTAHRHVTAVEHELVELERAYDQVSMQPTAEQLDRLHTDDFTMTARGRVTTKAELLARTRDPKRPAYLIESLTSDIVKIRVYGDTAVITGRWTRVSKDSAGQDSSAAGFFTHVWLRRNKRWQLAVAHYSPRVDQAQQQ